MQNLKFNNNLYAHNPQQLAADIKTWGRELGFAQVGITDINLKDQAQYFSAWLLKKYYGEMDYLLKNQELRYNPALLMPCVKSVIVCRMNYPVSQCKELAGYSEIAAYAKGRDYHKTMRKKLQLLAEKISKTVEVGCNYRVFCDSAPVLEKALAVKAGLGWIGKNSLLINEQDGSYFFLGEIYINFSLPIDQPLAKSCGTCRRCLDVCPTGALQESGFMLDARRCIAYLTIEHKGIIPCELRPLIGTRIFGCDACQNVCPWNQSVSVDQESILVFKQRFARLNLVDLFLWTKEQFLERTAGTVLRRVGYEGWLRNLAIALGNAPFSAEHRAALQTRIDCESELVREHVRWAMGRCY